jgi:hypothetical protein
MSRIEELLRSMSWDEKLAQRQVVFRPDPPEQLGFWTRGKPSPVRRRGVVLPGMALGGQTPDAYDLPVIRSVARAGEKSPARIPEPTPQ